MVRQKSSSISHLLRLKTFFADHPVWIAILIASILVSVVVPIAYYKGFYKGSFVDDIFVEIHGLIFDIVLIGGLILFFTKLGEQEHTIRRYREEIEDYLGWNADEAKYRIVGNIRRLNMLGVTSINLAGAYLAGADLRFANLTGADLSYSNLQGANLQHCILINASLHGARLEGSKLSGYGLNLRSTIDDEMRHYITSSKQDFCNNEMKAALRLSSHLRHSL